MYTAVSEAEDYRSIEILLLPSTSWRKVSRIKQIKRLQVGCFNGQIKYGAASTKRLCTTALNKATGFNIAAAPKLDLEKKFKVYSLWIFSSDRNNSPGSDEQRMRTQKLIPDRARYPQVSVFYLRSVVAPFLTPSSLLPHMPFSYVQSSPLRSLQPD